MRRYVRPIIIVTAAVLLATSCGSGGSGFNVVQRREPVVRQESDDEWTFMLYFAADNDLEAAALADMVELSTLASSPEVNLVVFIDRFAPVTGSPDRPDGPVVNLEDFSTAKLLVVDEGQYSVVEDLGEVDSGSPDTLAWFIETSLQRFPAERYALTLWDHGGGWTGVDWDFQDSLDGDSSDHTFHSITDVRDAIVAGMGDEGRLDLLAFDACLMAGYEVAAATAPYADYLLLSEETIPNDGFNYYALGDLVIDPSMDARQLGESLLRGYGEHYAALDDGSFTLSLLDAGHMGQVEQAMDGFASVAADNMSATVGPLARARDEALVFGNVSPSVSFNMVDLGDLLRRMAADTPAPVLAARDSLYAALDQLVVSQYAGNLAADASGLAVYFPPDSSSYDSQYDDVVGMGAWQQLLQSYFGTAEQEAGAGVAFADALALQEDATGVLATGYLVPGGEDLVSSAEGYGGVVADDSSILYLLGFDAEVGSGGDPQAVAAGWDFSYLEVGDGSTFVPATTFLVVDGDAIEALISLQYEGVDGTISDAVLDVAVDPATGSLTSLGVYIFDDSGGAAELSPRPGDLLRPVNLVEQPGSQPQLVGGGVAFDASTLLVARGAGLASGTPYAFVIEVADAAGNSAVASNVSTVP